MGNTGSSGGRGHHEDNVDFGSLTPQGVYTGPKDWNDAIVSQLICERKLAPFYRPLDDFEDSWDDEQILAARKELPEVETGNPESSSARHEPSHSINSKHSNGKRTSAVKEGGRCPEAAIYTGAVECPICFLYYPPNINHSRCCDQAICTECFVQIKRAEPTTTHIVSEPAACPYCVQDKFGVVYTPPVWRSGIGSDGAVSPNWTDPAKGLSPDAPRPTHKRRTKSFSHDSPEVVTTDQIRPDWESKLAAVRAAVTRRANRRIIMRQVGDRLIPVGVTSGRVHPLSPEEAAQLAQEDAGGSRRSRRSRTQNQDLNQLLGQMGLGGQDLEELMMMEAMRLSMLDHEEHQRKEAEERAKNTANGEINDGSSSTPIPTSSSNVGTASSSASPILPSGDFLHSSLAPSSHTPESPTSNEVINALPPHPSSAINIARTLTPVPVSRNRTPSPKPSDSLRSTNESSSWRRTSSSPRPFGTIAAAMTAATATVVLGNIDVTSSTLREPSLNTSGAGTPVGGSSNPVPATAPAAAPISSSSISFTDNTERSLRPVMTIPMQSYASSIFSTDSTGQTGPSSYDILDSESDSEMAREPLLGSGPPTPTLDNASEIFAPLAQD